MDDHMPRWSRETIPKGSFVCLYLGKVISDVNNKIEVAEALRKRRPADDFTSEEEEKFYLYNKTVSYFL